MKDCLSAYFKWRLLRHGKVTLHNEASCRRLAVTLLEEDGLTVKQDRLDF